ncbi:MAG: HlyD family efflux transporter periplasmic adaptor subunit [Eubacteriales bacterium]|nr:HlyD family efflux transporter periplasmic adaptor subunit [Eubacteriales bacterium]
MSEEAKKNQTEKAQDVKENLGAAAAAEARKDPELAKKTAAAVPDSVAAAGEPQARKLDKDAKKERKKKKRRGKHGWIKWVLLLLVLGAGAFFYLRQKRAAAAASETTVDAKNIGTVTRGDIQSELTSSGTLAAKDTYTITSLVEGEIIEANFEEGDQVQKGDVLYRIDPSDMDREIESAQKNLQYAQDDLADAKDDLAKAQSDLGGGVWYSDFSGYIQNLSLSVGDTVGQNTEIADLYNDTAMKLKVPFLSLEADAIAVGTQVVVRLSDTGEEIPGQVIEKSSMEETLTGGTMVKYITVLVTNPGGLTTSDKASVQTGDLYSAEDGSFEAYTSSKLKYDLSQSVKVASVLVHDGDYVTAGTPIFTMTADSLSEALKQYEKSVEQAEQSLDTAQDNLEKQQESLEDYTITAPISGQVISKSGKVGDKISRSSGSSDTTLAIIYDLSELTFEMSIDELDISKVEVGQEVEVTADAFEDETYTGHVTNVSLNGSNSNGVTTYPVTVTMDDMGDLLPSMNVDGTIILEKAEDVLYIPINALQRGNIVYVRDTSLTDEQKSTSEGTGEAEAPASLENGAPEGGNMENAPDMSEMPEAGSAEGAPAGELPSQAASGGNTRAAGLPRANDIPDGFTAVRVETGLTSEDYVEITSGLSEGQEVYVKDSESSTGGFMWGGGMGGPGGGGMGGGPGGGGGGPRG